MVVWFTTVLCQLQPATCNMSECADYTPVHRFLQHLPILLVSVFAIHDSERRAKRKKLCYDSEHHSNRKTRLMQPSLRIRHMYTTVSNCLCLSALRRCCKLAVMQVRTGHICHSYVYVDILGCRDQGRRAPSPVARGPVLCRAIV